MGCNCSQDSDSDDINEEGEGIEHPVHVSEDGVTEGLIEPEQQNTITNEDDHDLFKTYAEVAQQETKNRASQVDATTDIFSRIDIKLLPDIEGNFGRIDNEESGEYIITFWARTCGEQLFVPTVLSALIVRHIDMVYRSRWSNHCKGPDFKVNILDKCKSTVSNKYAMKQGIRAVNCCLRDKVSVFYIEVSLICGRNDLINTTNDNFIGIVTEWEDTFNIPVPLKGYGIAWAENRIYRGNTSVQRQSNKPNIGHNRTVKCVVDLREGQYLFKCLWRHSETVIRLPHLGKYEDIKWYPYVSGNLSNTTSVITFDEFTSKEAPRAPPPPPLSSSVLTTD